MFFNLSSFTYIYSQYSLQFQIILIQEYAVVLFSPRLQQSNISVSGVTYDLHLYCKLKENTQGK